MFNKDFLYRVKQKLKHICEKSLFLVYDTITKFANDSKKLIF